LQLNRSLGVDAYVFNPALCHVAHAVVAVLLSAHIGPQLFLRHPLVSVCLFL